jgi:hypothetical protein
MMPAAGDVLSITKDASVQFISYPILFRVIRVMEQETRATYYGWVWLEGYEIDSATGDALQRRSIFVQLAGLRPARTGADAQDARRREALRRNGTGR